MGEWEAFCLYSSLVCGLVEAEEFSAVIAPVSSLYWFSQRDERESGLEVELALFRPCIALIAARVPLYMSTFLSPNCNDLSGETFEAVEDETLVCSCTVEADSITSAFVGKRSSRFASHSETNLVRGSVAKNG